MREVNKMPRTKPLTAAQREMEEQRRICKEILDRLNEKRGRERKTAEVLAKELGISDYTWWRWNSGGISTGELGRVITVLYRAGFKLNLEKIS